MEALNKAYTQLAELVRAMTPRARALSGLLLALVLGSIGYLVWQEIAGEKTYLLGGQAFSVDEITAIQGALGKAQLNDFVVEGNRIRIPRDRQAAYLAALADGNALPQTLTDVFTEATDKTTWFTSRHQQIEHSRTGKKKVLSLILRDIDGVESADVDFDKEEPRGLKQERAASALVAVKLRGGRPLDEDRAICFQKTAAAVLMMNPQDVTVVDKTSHAVFGGRGAAASGGMADDYRGLKRKYQADYEETVRHALAFVPGVTVSADVELEKELRREEQRVEYDASSSIAVRHNKETTSVTNEGYDLQGRQLLVTQGDANQPGNLSTVTLPPPKTTKERSTVTEDVAPAHNQTRTEIAGLTPKRVSISIGVPTSYFEEVWRERRQSPASEQRAVPPAAELAQIQNEEIARIRAHVARLIPNADPAVDASQLVTVTPFARMVAPEAAEPALATIVLTWLASSWTRIVSIGALVAGFLMLRSLIRAGTQAQSASSTSTKTRPENPHERGASSPAVADFPQRVASGGSLRHELADVVRQDPALAANILRSWIGNAN